MIGVLMNRLVGMALKPLNSEKSLDIAIRCRDLYDQIDIIASNHTFYKLELEVLGMVPRSHCPIAGKSARIS